MWSKLPSERAGSDNQGLEPRRPCSRIFLLTIILVLPLIVILCRILMHTHGFINISFLSTLFILLEIIPILYNVSLFILVLNIWGTWFIILKCWWVITSLRKEVCILSMHVVWSWNEGTVRNSGKCRDLIPFHFSHRLRGFARSILPSASLFLHNLGSCMAS